MLEYHMTKAGKTAFNLTDGYRIIIPSRMYPLESEGYSIFTRENTEKITDDAVASIMDSLKFDMGHCFTNCENLSSALNAAGYPAQQYVGWVFLDDSLPVHHSFIVMENHVIDTAILITREDEDYIREHTENDQEARKLLSHIFVEKQELKNHEKCTYGRCYGNTVYIGAPGSREQGIRTNERLRKEYPDHPCFSDLQGGNLSPMQMQILEEGGR